MPLYAYTCEFDGHEVEMRLPVERRDLVTRCHVHHRLLKRKIVFPLGVNWEGKFLDRATKVRDGEW
jgi:hypothetical protein